MPALCEVALLSANLLFSLGALLNSALKRLKILAAKKFGRSGWGARHTLSGVCERIQCYTNPNHIQVECFAEDFETSIGEKTQ